MTECTGFHIIIQWSAKHSQHKRMQWRKADDKNDCCFLHNRKIIHLRSWSWEREMYPFTGIMGEPCGLTMVSRATKEMYRSRSIYMSKKN